MIFYLHKSLSNGRYFFCSYILERSCGKICSKEVSIPCSGAQKRHISASFTVRLFLLHCGGVFQIIRRRRRQRRRFKSELAFFQSSRYYSNSLASWNVGEVLLELNHKVRKRKNFFVVCFSSSIEREVEYFHVVVVQWQEQNPARSAPHLLSCFAY